MLATPYKPAPFFILFKYNIMSNSDKGLASQSAEKRRAIQSKGGKTVFARGTGHIFDASEARQAGLKSAAGKKHKKAKYAAIRLISIHGFEPKELAWLGLSEDEWLYYGGEQSYETRLMELRQRITQYEQAQTSNL